MDANDLRAALKTLGLTQVELGRLISVTPRAIALWIAEDREVPGPVAAYLGLLLSLPQALRAKELSRLTGRTTPMEGLYSFTFHGSSGGGLGALVLIAGRVFGSDGGVTYDGTYTPNPLKPDHIDVSLKLTIPPGVALVQGVGPQPAEYRFDLKLTVPGRGGPGRVETPFGPVDVNLQYLRGVPAELMAA